MIPEPAERAIAERKQPPDNSWREESCLAMVNPSIRKRFINCKCPKCSMHHDVYMRWAGRGTPRKYCIACRNVVSGYDDAVFFEASVTSRKNQGKRLHHAID